ncbi:GDP-GTP exchange factor [Klebsormidium nitens]|uniref:GDP-GTP exchange factor n=1 Tax=Klebsormidium nitens TaxID=105231 RepID=A0A1Y1I3E1_KLENI|nr:GDP-GTP exchange factor [Klebsormidium nitens]|eukprot:GAQ85003.1 GDP-GTP exchange factor [Klebsormidium nitens]
MTGPQVATVGEGTRWTGAHMACLIMTEVDQVIAMMRQDAQWADVPRNLDEAVCGGPFLQEFKDLSRDIFAWKHWATVKPMDYLAPFLGLIRSKETSAPVTGVALLAVYKIVTFEMFHKESVDAAEAMHLIVDAVTGCEFRASDPASEEFVLLQIGQVLLACLRCGAGPLLRNADVINIINTCLHVAFAKGKLLQRMICQTMQDIVRAIFGRLHEFGPAEDGLPRVDATDLDTDVTSSGEATASAPAKSSARSDGNERTANRTDAGIPVRSLSKSSDGPAGASETADSSRLGAGPERVPASAEIGNGPQELSQTSPYGLPCLVEVLRLLCSLIVPDRKSSQHEDRTQFGLALLSAAIEVAGGSCERHPRILALVTDDLFRNLMQAGQSSNLLVLSLVSSIVRGLYWHFKRHLKLQMAAFFENVVLRAAQGGYHQQEAALEILQDFCRQPSFISEMYANADGDITCGNTFENLSNLLSKNAFPDKATLSALNLLSFEGLLAVVQCMADRADNASVSGSSSSEYNLAEVPHFWTLNCDNWEDPEVWVEFLRRQKYVKRRLMIGADHFNRDPIRGLEFLQNVHLLPEQLDPASVAFFLYLTPGLDKNVLGDYLSSSDSFNISILECFTKQFNFTGMALDGALRTYLEAFRLPGEAQKISRVLESFASHYYEQCPQVFAHEDVVSALSHSVLMLNSNLHTKKVTRKVTEEDFIRSNQKINVGKELPREMLTQLYRSIAENEIPVSSESLVAEPSMTHGRWLDLLRRSQATTPFLSCDPTEPLLDRDMFSVIWGPAIAAISAVFDHAEKADTLQQCVAGFLAAAKISAAHHMSDVLDNLVVDLCKFITPFGDERPATENTKARMAATAVSEIVDRHGDMIRSGRRRSIESILRLHKLGLPSTTNDPSQDGQNQPSDSREGLSILANAAAASVVGIEIVSASRNRGGSADTNRDQEQSPIDAQRGSARGSLKTSPPKARNAKALNPLTQAYIPPTRRASGSQDLPASKLSNLVESKTQPQLKPRIRTPSPTPTQGHIQSKPQTQTPSPNPIQTQFQPATPTQTQPTVKVPEPSKSALNADSPSWQPPSKLAASALKGLALGGAQNSLSKSLSIPSADARKKDTDWDVQLPDGFVEAAVSPVGISDSAFNLLGPEGEGEKGEAAVRSSTGATEREGADAAPTSDGAKNQSDSVDLGYDDLPENLDGLADDDMSNLDAVLNAVPGFNLISDDEDDDDHAEQSGGDHENGSDSRAAHFHGAHSANGGPNGRPSSKETGKGWLAVLESRKATQAETSGRETPIATEGKQMKRQEEPDMKAKEGRKPDEAERRPAETAGPTWRQETKAPEPLEWRKRQTAQSSHWRDDRRWTPPVDPRKPFGEANPLSAGSPAGGAPRGGFVSQLILQPPEKPKQPPEVRERLPAGMAPREPSSRTPLLKAFSSQLASVPTPPPEAGPAGRLAQPNNAGASVPPGFSKPLPATERAPPAVAPSQPISSTREVVSDSEPRSSSPLAGAPLSKPGVPSRLVLSRVLVKRTVVQEGHNLGPPAESPVCQDAEVHVDKRSQLHLRAVAELGSGPNGQLQDLPSWLGRPVDLSDGPKGFFEAVPKVSDDVSRPVSGLSSSERRSAIAENPASAGAPEGDTWRTGGGERQAQQPWRVPFVESGGGETKLRAAVASPPPPPVVHPQEMLRRLLPPGAHPPLTSSTSDPEPFSQVALNPRPDSSPHFASLNPAENRGSWVPAPQWAPQVQSRPPSSIAQVPSAFGQHSQAMPDQELNYWSSTNHDLNPPQDSLPPGSSGWPGEVDAFRTDQHPAEHGNSANNLRSHPLQNHPSLAPPAAHYQSGFAPLPPTSVPNPQTPPLSALQNAPHIRKLQATVQEHFQRTGGLKSPGEVPSPNSQPAEFPPFGAAYKPESPVERSCSGGRDGSGGRWGDNTVPGYQQQAQYPSFNGEDFRGPEVGRNHNGGQEYMVNQAPLPELLGPAGSLLPRERPSPYSSHSEYDHVGPYAHHPFAHSELPREATQESMVLPPEYLHGRPSMSPELPTERSPQGGNAASRAPERKGAYNPLQQQVAPQEKAKPNEDSVSDADLQKLLDDCALLDASQPEAGEPVERGAWGISVEAPAPWRDVRTAEIGNLDRVREGERLNEAALAAHTAGRVGANGAVRTAAQMVAGRPDEEQFEADIKAAMDVSLEEYRSQGGASQRPAAQTKSWPSVRVSAAPKPAVGKGLANRSGEYNCFLNVIIQSLWHLVPFRRNVMLHPVPKRPPSDAPLYVRRQAVLHGLKGIFRALSADDGKPTAVDPSSLRTALHDAHKGSDLFQMEEMNDASEVLLSIFGCLHEALQAPVVASPPKHADGLLPTPSNSAALRNKATDVCRGSCFVHDLFGLDMVEFTHCGLCNKRTHDLHYQQYFHLVNCSALSDVAVQSPGRPFAPLLRRVLDGSTPLRPCDKDEGGCGEPLPTTHVLDKAPQLFTVVLVWGSAQASQSQVRSVVNAISTQIRVSEIFPDLKYRGQHALRCVVCYYGLHYFAFAFSAKAQQWLLLDDTHVKVVGPWEKVVEQCTNGRLQPSVLFYQSL